MRNKQESNKRYYAKNSDTEKARFKVKYRQSPVYFVQKNRERRQRLREFIWNQKMGCACAHCGVSDPRVRDFHHNGDSKKEESLSKFASKNWGEKRILEEIRKCIVLCANCHRILHYRDASPVPDTAAGG